MLKNKKSYSLYCFSPPVMIATFAIEIIGAIYTLWKAKPSRVKTISVALCMALAIFQFAEFFVCTSSAATILASKLGYVAITALPPLGLWLMATLIGKKYRVLVAASATAGIALAVGFLVNSSVFTSHQCTGNYVIFGIGEPFTTIYGGYYFGLLLVGNIVGIKHWLLAKKDNLRAYKWMLLGYWVFMVPVAILTILRPTTTRGVPSIMCGFAVLLAVILVTKVVPIAEKESRPATKKSK
jgi:hypothetical protein